MESEGEEVVRIAVPRWKTSGLASSHRSEEAAEEQSTVVESRLGILAVI